MLTFAITDVHGRLDLLGEALEKCERRADGEPYRLVFMGDYIDRGPDSRGVLSLIKSLSETREEVYCLCGNHEDMLLRSVILKDRSAQSTWISNGGVQCLSSYGEISDVISGIQKDELDQTLAEHARWLNTLGFYFSDGIRLFVHAGIEPGVPIKEQKEDVFMWTRSRRFFDATREEMGCHVVHGHTPAAYVDTKKPADHLPTLTEARTNLDTGAYATGRLTVGVFDDSKPQPIETIVVADAELDPFNK